MGIPDALQYGAFGALLLVLFYVWKWVNARLSSDEDARKAKATKDEERLVRQETFLHDMMAAEKAERQAQEKLWREMMNTEIETRAGLLTALDGMNESVATSCETQKAHHKEVMTKLETLDKTTSNRA